MRILILSLVMAANLAAQNSLEIIAAYWGNGNNFADVTARVRSAVQNDGLNFAVQTPSIGVDPLPGGGKVLRVYYRQNGQFNQGEWTEGQYAQIGARGNFLNRAVGGLRGNLRVTRAVYGMGSQVQDVTSLVQSRVMGNRLDLQITNENLGGDPAPQRVKDFAITYEYQGRSYDIRLHENDWLRLPDGTGAPANVVVPGLRIIRAQYGLNNRIADVTNLLAGRIAGDRLSINVDNNSLGGDPARGDDKQLYVIYEVNGQRMEKRVNEGTQLMLP